MTLQEQQYIFDQWLHQHKALFFKIVRTYAFTPMDRDDLFQEITLQVWHSIPSFKNEAAVSTWLYRIAFNTAIKWSQKEQKHHTARAPLDSVEHILQDNHLPMDERLTWLYEEISKLNEVDRSITLLLLEGLSYREMALILGITESNIGVKINRIKKHLAGKSKKTEPYGL
ncbi:RNA polymerase sigma factor [Pseudoflavitalea sp. X16]|uniref:RNA polymerase sigma factor n=1 Tax=Paraflavitalea devenefica TaxID=2716334 RepID=UPI00141F56BD|nr:RNA polymerase sigma factor [Paraflavitalea devenefica]NII28991.1 RNA polymerase sigma factor [Paraflavitalea devenefica]